MGRPRVLAKGGFALIAALLSIWVLTALGMLVFSVTTQDVRVSSRTVGERKAFSAAQSGIHWLMPRFNPAQPNDSAKNKVVVSATDTNTRYKIGPHPTKADPTLWIPTSGPVGIPVGGYGGTWGFQRYLAQVMGENTAYKSNVQIDVGIGFGPVDISTVYR